MLLAVLAGNETIRCGYRIHLFMVLVDALGAYDVITGCHKSHRVFGLFLGLGLRFEVLILGFVVGL